MMTKEAALCLERSNILRGRLDFGQHGLITLFLLIVFAYWSASTALVEKGFVYCPAYPCVCESDNGALLVNCQYLYLTKLPKFLAFDGRIKTLSLRQNSIRHLPARAFQGLHVESLDLTENVISQVHDEAFLGLEQSLEELHLQVYAMEGMPSKAIRRLHNLKLLRIIGCKADTLSSSAFEGLTATLVELHLQGCRIKHIETGGLASLKQLQVLDLTGNSLRTEHLAQLAKLYNLRTLRLARNQITRLPNHAFDNLLHLRDLDVSHNQMTSVEPNAFKPLHYSLETLTLRGNQLNKDVFVAVASLRNLRHLELGANNISVLPAGALNKHDLLTRLELSDNGISGLDRQGLKGTEKYLKVLKLNGNPLTVVHNHTFGDHTRLQQLTLDGTSLGGALSVATFQGLNNTLRKLSLKRANLSASDLLALSMLVALEELDVSENFITGVPVGVFQNLNNLKKLDLSQNFIEILPDTALRGLEGSLEFVDLHDNYLQTISHCVFEDFQRLSDMRLKGNPLMCDCRLAWLHSWLHLIMPEHHRSLLEWRCESPDSVTRRLFGTLFMADLQCSANLSSLGLPQCNFTDLVKSYQELPFVDDLLSSPMMPTELLDIALHVEVLIRGREALLVLWNATITTTTSTSSTYPLVTGYRVVLRRSNDSFEEADITFSPEVTRYLFIDLIGQFAYEACVTVLGDENFPLGRDCVEMVTGNDSTTTTEDKVPQQNGTGALPISFTTLLWSYISGCVVASTLCAILAVVIRRHRRRRHLKKCAYHAGRSGGFNPGYSAWAGPRYSMPGSSSAASSGANTASSSCYFNTPSIASCGADDDGLFVTISGIDLNHSVVDRTSVTGEVDGEHGRSGYDEGRLAFDAASVRGSLGRGGTLGRGWSTMCGGGGVGFNVARGGAEVSYPTHGRCSTVSSFRRHLPANYIVTNTDMHGDEFFFHF